MKRLTLSLYLIATIVSQAGCIPFPTLGTKDPFGKKLSFIQPGLTSRSEVLRILSKPVQKRMGDKFFGYIGYEADTGFCFVTFIPLDALCIAGGTAHFIGIDFDDRGRVKQVSRAAKDFTDSNASNTHWRSCLLSGICLDYPSMMITAPANKDAEAKRFIARENACSIYLIGPQSPIPASLSLNLDGRDAGVLGSGTYLLWTPTAGLHPMYGQSLQGNADKPAPSFLSLPCEQERLVFIQTDANGNLNVLPELEGRKAVQASRRLLDAF